MTGYVCSGSLTAKESIIAALVAVISFGGNVNPTYGRLVERARR